jgi:hypothetical protein
MTDGLLSQRLSLGVAAALTLVDISEELAGFFHGYAL